MATSGKQRREFRSARPMSHHTRDLGRFGVGQCRQALANTNNQWEVEI